MNVIAFAVKHWRLATFAIGGLISGGITIYALWSSTSDNDPEGNGW